MISGSIQSRADCRIRLKFNSLSLLLCFPHSCPLFFSSFIFIMNSYMAASLTLIVEKKHLVVNFLILLFSLLTGLFVLKGKQHVGNQSTCREVKYYYIHQVSGCVCMCVSVGLEGSSDNTKQTASIIAVLNLLTHGRKHTLTSC